MSAIDELLSREWLATNGLGGYASSTFAGCNTRRYHGLLVAALEPPTGRTVLLSKLDETLWIGSIPFELAANEYHDGTIQPRGFELLSNVRIENGVPTFTYQFEDWVLEKKVWMEHEQNTTFVRYLLRGPTPACRMEFAPMCAWRDFHSHQHGSDNLQFKAVADDGGVRIEAFDGAQPYWLACDQPMGFDVEPAWYWQFLHREERERGLDSLEDLFRPGNVSTAILPDQPVLLRVTAEVEAAPFAGALARAEERFKNLFVGTVADRTPSDQAIQQLSAAADQFVVRRSSSRGRGYSIIAGYHWFSDWARDTMISLPGLTLTTGRYGVARAILTTFADLMDRGMLPNTFSETGQAQFNTVDGTLWFFHAIDRYMRASQDTSILKELFPVLEGAVDWHLKGTRHNIKVDAADGLLYAGEPGIQLTWMDAKVDGWVVTPRIGKPVEINALWFNAICLMAAWARDLQTEATDYQRLAAQIGPSFRQRFWNPDANCLYDVVDGPDGADASLRPNQLLAVSLPFAPMFGAQAKAIVDKVQTSLLTPFGLRTLAPDAPDYRGRYEGDQRSRDGAYHQGTVWPWLMGSFIDAHLRVYGDRAQAIQFLEPLVRHMDESAGLGTISEIFDGDAPHAPRGCIAQAWSVGEVLRVWSGLHEPPPPKPSTSFGGNHGHD